MKSIAFLLCIALMSCSCQSTKPTIQIEPAQNQVTRFIPALPALPVPPVPPEELEYVDVDGFRRLTLNAAVDDGSVRPLIKALSDIKGIKGFILEIDSGGGSVTAGFGLSKAIENAGVPVHCFVDGEGMSMAYYILQSCTTRSMTKRSILMIHAPAIHGGGGGNSNTWMTIAEQSRSMQIALIEHCVAKMKISNADLAAKIEVRPWWINWDEALKVGAVDHIINGFKDELKIAKNFK